MQTVLMIWKAEDCWSVIEALAEAGFQVVEEADSVEGLKRVLSEAPQLVIMDEAMPPANGAALLPALRRITDSPIIVVGTSDGDTIVWAFLEGADAYLARPVGTRELLARIASLLRRRYWNGETHSAVSLDADQISQIFDQLSRIEAHLFRHLLERRERLVPQEELVAAVWGAQGKNTSLRFYISQLRRKLADMGQAASLEILNFQGMGYVLTVRPRRVGASE